MRNNTNHLAKRNNALHLFLLLVIAISLTLVVNYLPQQNNSITGFDVGGFGIQADVTACGFINQPSTLTQNVFSTGTCFNITNSSLVFDCQGFNVSGTFAADGVTKAMAGFNITNSTIGNITIKNCNVFNFSYGVWINRSVNHTFVIGSNITNNTWGIYVDGGTDHNITHNNISFNNIGIELRAGENLTVDSNIITQNNQTGLLSRSLVKILNITNNTIRDQALPDANHGTQSLRILSSRDVLIRDYSIDNYSIQDSNITVWDTNEAKVEFFGFIATEGLNFSQDINITHNRIYVNATTRLGGSGWNVSSGLIFYNLSSSISLMPLVNLTDNPGSTNFAFCPSTGSNDDATCTNIIDTGENYSYDVNHFSTFTTNELRITQCPIQVNTTIELKQNLNGSGVSAGQACMTIANNSVILNCSGFRVTGMGVGIGVNLTNTTNATIKNCNIINFSVGINVSSSTNISLHNNNISNSSQGILLLNASNAAINNSVINASKLQGIFLINSSKITITNNSVTSVDSQAIYLLSSQNNSLTKSYVASTNTIGLYFSENSNNNEIINNTIKGNISIFIDSNSNNNNFNNNTVAGNTGFEINASTNTTITNSSFQNTNYSIKTALSSNFSLVDNERITNYSFKSSIPKIAKIGIAEVQYLSYITANGTNLSLDINLSLNKTHVNTTRSNGLNASANITLFGLTFTTPQIIVDHEDDGTFETCNSASGCINLSYSGGTLTFNVSSFTTYAANETFAQPAQSTPTLSGGSGSRTQQIIIIPQQKTAQPATTIAPTISPSLTTVNAITPAPAQNVQVSTPQSLIAPALSLLNPISPSATKETDIICGYTLQKAKTEISAQTIAQDNVIMPSEYELASKPFALSCDGDEIDLTISVPENYEDLRAIRCFEQSCQQINETTTTTDLSCGGYSIEKIRESQIQQKSETILLSKLNISFEAKTKIMHKNNTIYAGKNKIAFTGYLPKNLEAAIFPPKEIPNPQNQELNIIGTPITLKIFGQAEGQIPTALQLEYPNTKTIDEKSIAIYLLKNNKWQYLSGNLNTAEKTISTTFEDINTMLDENKEATFALQAINCDNCEKAKLTKISESKSKNAIIFVHGLLSNPATWQNIIDDYVLNKQQFQIWTFAYSSSDTTEKIAQEFKNQLEAHATEYDNAYIVAHSLGAIITQKTLSELDNQQLLQKIKKAILIASPNDGTPTIEIYKNFYNYLRESKTLQGIFNINSETIEELAKGIHVPIQQKIKYYVIAGTQSYSFNQKLFTQTNDGITTTKGAQHLGETYFNDTCANYYQVPQTHTELIYQPTSRKIIERIIAQELPKMNTLGYNQYAQIKIKNCKNGEKIAIIGKKIPTEKAFTPLNCACGNKVCGQEENEVNCPIDCAQTTTTKETTCLILPIIIPASIVALILLTAIYLTLKYVYGKEKQKIQQTIIYAIFAITLGLTIYQNTTCKTAITQPYFALLAILSLIILDAVFTKISLQSIQPKVNFSTKEAFRKIYDSYLKIAQWKNEIENSQNTTKDLRIIIKEDLDKTKKELNQTTNALNNSMKQKLENKEDLLAMQNYTKELLKYIADAKKKLK